MVKNKEDFFRIYAKAYFKRDASLLEDYLSQIIFYSRQSTYPDIMKKHSFIKFLNGKFHEQYLTTDKFYGIIKLVNRLVREPQNEVK